MKKFHLLSLLFGLTAGTLAFGAPSKQSQLITQLDSCEAILQDIQGNVKTAIPADILRRARGLIIVNQFQAGFFLGIKDGYGIAMVRRPNGQWSVPAFLKAGDISFGFQFGARSLNTIMVLLDDNTARLLFKSRLNFGTDAKAVAGIRSADKEYVTKRLPDGANVLVYTNQEGLMAGVALKTGFLSPDNSANETFYNAKHRMPELLYSDWVTPPAEAKFMMDYVTSITR